MKEYVLVSGIKSHLGSLADNFKPRLEVTQKWHELLRCFRHEILFRNSLGKISRVPKKDVLGWRLG